MAKALLLAAVSLAVLPGDLLVGIGGAGRYFTTPLVWLF
jgi:hypothetical protein